MRRRRGRGDGAAAPEHRWVDTEAALADVVARLSAAGVVAIDTEFHRERTYYPKLALLQVAWTGSGGDVEVALIDPLEVALDPLAPVLTSGATIVMHAADQDLEVLELTCGVVPAVLFDTQVAAGFAGYSTPGLTVLVEGELGIRLPKADRLTDWLHRPLGVDQLRYAAADVVHLQELQRRLVQRLTERGRLAWAEDECESVRRKARRGRDPEEAWLRIKEARSLRGPAAGVAQAVAAWRERRAAEADQPVRFVLGDLGVVGIAQRRPTSVDELAPIRGVDDRHARGRTGREVLAAVAEGMDRRPTRPHPPASELDRRLRPAVTLVSAWLSQLSRDLSIDSALLATRADIEAFLAGTDGARLAEGWRAEVVGEPVRRLVAGDAALAFDGTGNLVLEDRSPGRPRR